MRSGTVRISESSHRLLRRLAEETRTTMNAVLDAALADYERRLFWLKAAAEFDGLRANPKTWKREMEERAEWDETLADRTMSEVKARIGLVLGFDVASPGAPRGGD